jgi:hypothetical protein
LSTSKISAETTQAIKPLCFIFRNTGAGETFEGLLRLRRIVAAELVIHDFHDRGIQNWVGLGRAHVESLR